MFRTGMGSERAFVNVSTNILARDRINGCDRISGLATATMRSRGVGAVLSCVVALARLAFVDIVASSWVTLAWCKSRLAFA